MKIIEFAPQRIGQSSLRPAVTAEEAGKILASHEQEMLQAFLAQGYIGSGLMHLPYAQLSFDVAEYRNYAALEAAHPVVYQSLENRDLFFVALSFYFSLVSARKLVVVLASDHNWALFDLRTKEARPLVSGLNQIEVLRQLGLVHEYGIVSYSRFSSPKGEVADVLRRILVEMGICQKLFQR